MGYIKTQGFTIIEVMLFLAVTGLLTIGILAGSGIAVGQQRYRDSVNSFKTLLQDQFSQTSNIINSRSGDESCANAVVLAPPETVPNPQSPGTSNCLLMGRLLTVGSDGTQVITSNVIGYRTSVTAEVEPTDLEELQKNYTLSTSSVGQVVTALEWDARTTVPNTQDPYSFSFLVISSPVSGSIMTFAQEGIQTNLNQMVAAGVLSNDVVMCVNANAGTFVGERLAVKIGSFAATQSAIEIPPGSEGICD